MLCHGAFLRWPPRLAAGLSEANQPEECAISLFHTNRATTTHASDTISFTLTNTGGTWASASDVLVANAQGYDAVAHIFVCEGTGTDCNASTDALATGFAGEGGVGVPVPEPSALLLLGIGLGGMAALNWRRQRRP
jgi:hypothetical protein